MDGRNSVVRICTNRATRKIAMKMAVATRYPRSIDIETASPPVSPSVVARILMIQKPRVSAGTFTVIRSETVAARRINLRRQLFLAFGPGIREASRRDGHARLQLLGEQRHAEF